MDDNSIALFEFGTDADEAIVKLAERHYRLVPEHEVSSEELQDISQPSPGVSSYPASARTRFTTADAALAISDTSFITVTNS